MSSRAIYAKAFASSLGFAVAGSTYGGCIGGDHVFTTKSGTRVLVDLVIMQAQEVGDTSCLERRMSPDAYAGVNALRIETRQPMGRCARKLPSHWPEGMTATRWELSGGSCMVFGLCTPSACPSVTTTEN